MSVDSVLPLVSLPSIIATTGALVVLWAFLKSYVERRGAFQWAETLLDTHDFVTASLSIALAAYVADIGHGAIFAKTGYEPEPALLGYLYHLLKIYEYADIILLIMSGTSKVSKYTAFSHLFLPYWSYYRIIARPDKSVDWRFQVIADCVARFASRAIPWLVEDLKTEESLLKLAEEARWYPDLAITAFWAIFTLQGQRDSEQGIKSFGQPYKDEMTARVLSVAILLYAGYARRQEEAQRSTTKTEYSKSTDQKTATVSELASRNSTKTGRSSSKKAK